MYRLIHSSVDGAGVAGEYPTLEAAKAEANRLQARSDSTGNQYGYTYHVFSGDEKLYRTRSAVQLIGVQRVELCGEFYHIAEYLLSGSTFAMVANRNWGRARRFPSVDEALTWIADNCALVPA